VARPIVWSDPAVEDLEAAVEFIAKDSAAYARTLAQLTVDAAESLGEFPHRGHRLRDPQLSRFRELIIGSYRLVYLVEPERVLIVAILHGHRALRRALKGRKP
jgi:toxin ParE1/3/4